MSSSPSVLLYVKRLICVLIYPSADVDRVVWQAEMSLHARGFPAAGWQHAGRQRRTGGEKKKKKVELTLLTCHLNQVCRAHVPGVGSNSEGECRPQDAVRKKQNHCIRLFKATALFVMKGLHDRV